MPEDNGVDTGSQAPGDVDGGDVVSLEEARIDKAVAQINAFGNARLDGIGETLVALGQQLAGGPSLEVVGSVRDMLLEVANELNDWRIPPLDPDKWDHLFERYRFEVLGETPWWMEGDE